MLGKHYSGITFDLIMVVELAKELTNARGNSWHLIIKIKENRRKGR